MERLGTAVIGAGRIGKIHAGNLARLLPRARLVAVSDVRLEAVQECARELGLSRAVTDHCELLADNEVQAVVICSSTDTHAQLIEEAAAAGKHIFCEKPIHLDLARIDRALAAVARAGVKLQVGFNRRFDPSFRRVRDLVAAGRIGRPHLLSITSRDPEPPPLDYVRRSGGIFLDMTIHDFDMARYLMGSEVVEVHACGAALLDPRIAQAGDIDTAVVLLRFEEGALGAINNSRRAVYGYDQRIEIFGEGGMVSAGNETPDETVVSDREGVHGALPLHFFLERYEQSYLAEMEAFVECVLEDRVPPVTGLDGRMPVVMGHAARRSYDENRPVRLEEIDPGIEPRRP